MKKVLIIAPDFFGYDKSAERAFQKVGIETRLIQVSYLFKNLGERLEYYSGKDKYFIKRKKDLNERVLSEYREFQPDLVFLIQECDIERETLRQMNNAAKAIWAMDTINRTKREFVIWDLLDYNFFFEKTDLEVLWEQHKIEGYFLPLALDESIYFPTAKTESIDLLFVGALYNDRLALLKKICTDHPEKNVQVYGIQIASLLKRMHFKFFREHKKSFRNKNIDPSEVNKLYNQSKVCLNIHHPQNKHGVNQRFFEIPGSQSFQLVNDNGFISENFGKDEMMTYGSAEEMLYLLEQLFRGEINTKAMALKAYKKIIAEHTFTHRMEYVVDTVAGSKKKVSW